MKVIKLFAADIEGSSETSPEPKPVASETVKKNGAKPKKKSAKRSKLKASAKRKPAKKHAKPSKRAVVKKTAKRKPVKKRSRKSNGGRPLMFPDKTIVRMPKGFLKIINAKARTKKQRQGEYLRAVIARAIGK